MRATFLSLALCLAVPVMAQQATVAGTSAASGAPRTPYYIDPSLLRINLLVEQPPAAGSPANDAELAELHRIEASRTPKEVELARADDLEEDIFIFKAVLGPGFTEAALPITASLSAHVRNEQSVAGGELKRYFRRPRPSLTDPSLHPVCAAKPGQDSYPSGHALTGYLEALTLVQLVPGRRDEILARADQYAHNRTVCGVHYPSDTEASRRVAYAIFGYMLATPRFQQDLAAARQELRTRLGPGME